MPDDMENNNENPIDIGKTVDFYMETKDYDGIISFCEKIIKDYDNSEISPLLRKNLLKVPALNFITLAYKEKGNYAAAIKYCYEVIKILPESPITYSILASAYEHTGYLELKPYCMGLYKLLDEREKKCPFIDGFTCLTLPKLIDECKRKCSYKNSILIGGLFYALYIYTKNEIFYPISIKQFLNTLKLHPKKHETYLYLSCVYKENKDYKEAIKAVAKALGIKPNNKNYIYQLGNLYYKSEKYKLALKMFEKYLKLHKKSNKYIDYILSKSHFMSNDYKSAINLIDKNISADSENADFYELLGDLYSKTCLIDKTIENYKKAIYIEPLCLRIIFKLADLYYRLEDYKNSLKYYEKMDEIGPPDSLKDDLKQVILEIKSKLKEINN